MIYAFHLLFLLFCLFHIVCLTLSQLQTPTPSKQTEMEQDIQSSQSSEAAAKAVLLEECEQQFGLLQKVTCHGLVFSPEL